MAVETIVLIPNPETEAQQALIQEQIQQVFQITSDPSWFLAQWIRGSMGKNTETKRIFDLIQETYANVARMGGQVSVFDERTTDGILKLDRMAIELNRLATEAFVRVVQFYLNQYIGEGQLREDDVILLDADSPHTVYIRRVSDDGDEAHEELCKIPRLAVQVDPELLVEIQGACGFKDKRIGDLLPFEVKRFLGVPTSMIDQMG